MMTNTALFNEALTEVHNRFILTLEDISNTYKLFCQIELGWWFYEDNYADKYDDLPHYNRIRAFGEVIFRFSSILQPYIDRYNALYDEFHVIRVKTPTAGCLLLNTDLTKLVLVCSWDESRWGFPKGKIEDNESAFEAAIREVDEETGFDPRFLMVAEQKLTEQQHTRLCTLFIVPGVPENTEFKPKTQKEISIVKFFNLNDIPKNAYNTSNMIGELRKWIKRQKKESSAAGGLASSSQSTPARSRRKKDIGYVTPIRVNHNEEDDVLGDYSIIGCLGEESLLRSADIFCFDVTSVMRDIDRELFRLV